MAESTHSQHEVSTVTTTTTTAAATSMWEKGSARTEFSLSCMLLCRGKAVFGGVSFTHGSSSRVSGRHQLRLCRRQLPLKLHDVHAA